jgi:hypothetical protein
MHLRHSRFMAPRDDKAKDVKKVSCDSAACAESEVGPAVRGSERGCAWISWPCTDYESDAEGNCEALNGLAPDVC